MKNTFLPSSRPALLRLLGFPAPTCPSLYHPHQHCLFPKCPSHCPTSPLSGAHPRSYPIDTTNSLQGSWDLPTSSLAHGVIMPWEPYVEHTAALSRHCLTKRSSGRFLNLGTGACSHPREWGGRELGWCKQGKLRCRDCNLEGQWQPLPHRAGQDLRNVGIYNIWPKTGSDNQSIVNSKP